MNNYELKEIFTSDVQRKTNKQVLMQHLNDHLDCIVKSKTNSYMIKFIYNKSYEKKWEFSYDDFVGLGINKSLYCVFVCQDDKTEFSYHIINLLELLAIYDIEPRKFIYDDNKYYFDDIDDVCKDNWGVFV